MTGSTTPAGWYPAPGDPTSERYWDGSTWTGKFRPLGGSATATSGRSDSDAVGLPFYRRRGIQITAGVILVLAFLGSLLEETPPDPAVAPAPAVAPVETPTPTPAPAPAPAPEQAVPSDLPVEQQAFIALIREFQDTYDAAETDLQRANVRVQRRRALCDLIPGRTITDWVGTVSTIGGNSDGDAYLDLEISRGINIGTWNNRISDIFDNTLIVNSDPLYETLLALTKGASVVFSGEFLQSSDECLRTSNLTEAFDMSRPDFKFRFSAVAQD